MAVVVTGRYDEFHEEGLNLEPTPEGSEWAYGWYCPACGAELGEPGDAEPMPHCVAQAPAWEWMLAPIREGQP